MLCSYRPPPHLQFSSDGGGCVLNDTYEVVLNFSTTLEGKKKKTLNAIHIVLLSSSLSGVCRNYLESACS